MKKGKFRPTSQPTVRILLVAPHLYQVSLLNINGYLKKLLLDRCKKVDAHYRYFQNFYFVDSTKLLQLKTQFQHLLHIPNPDPQMKFKIEDFPMGHIKTIMRNQKLNQSKTLFKNRVIFIDQFSHHRYFYAKKRIEQIFSIPPKDQPSKSPKIILILTSEINKKLWTSVILKNNHQPQVKHQMEITKDNYQLIELTFSELTSKKPTNHQFMKNLNPHPPNEPHKVYLITFDNLKFVEDSWFLTEVKKASVFFTDDAEFLISIESELATLESKRRNFEAYEILLKNYSLQNELIIFLSKVPQPCDMQNLLILTKPKNFTGIKSPISFKDYFNERLLKLQQRKSMEEFSLWFKKRYRSENRCFNEIYYLLNNVVLKTLDEKVYERNPGLIPSLELSSTLSENYQIHLLQSSSQLIEKFKTMDKKYKKQCPTINLREILESLHDKQKSEVNKFQITNKIDDHLMNKNSKLYFFEARELMINSKMDALLRKLFFVVSVQKQRIAIIVEDEKVEKRIKKYFKETQIEYFEYSLTRSREQISEHQLPMAVNSHFNPKEFSEFDSKPDIPVCLINMSLLYKEHSSLVKEKKRFTENNYEDNPYADNLNECFQAKVCLPKITTAGSVHLIDSFWHEFNFEKQLLISQIFNIQLSFIDQIKHQNGSSFQQVFRKPHLPSNYYLFEGSHEKAMLQKYLQRKQELQSFKQQPIDNQDNLLSTFIDQMIQAQKMKFNHLNCQVIDFLDIDEEFDKIQEQAKRGKCSKGSQVPEQKVFLPKFTKPENKSFKQMIEERLNLKNIDQILDQSDDDFKQEPETMAQPQMKDEQRQKSQDKNIFDQDKVDLKYDAELDFFPQESSKKFENVVYKKNCNELDQYFLFDVLLPNACQIPQIKPETIRLQSRHFKQSQATQSPQILDRFDSQEQNQSSKDLFDQLLAPYLNSDCLSLKKSKQFESQEEVETQSECDEVKNISKLQKVLPNQPKIQHKFNDSLLFQNFGSMIYQNKNPTNPQQPTQTTLKTQIQSQKSSFLPNFSKQITKQEDSIEIIAPSEVIDLEKLSEIKSKKKNNLGISKSQQNPKRIFKKMSGPIPYYEVPKGKRLSGKKFYEEAISKSKQLWEKKLKKQKETIILAQKRFELSLVPKQNWKEQLTEEEKTKLEEKGINLKN